MNREKIDEILKDAFKLEIRQEFKEDLKKKLLSEYDKKRKKASIYKISTVVAACFVLTLLILLNSKFFDKLPNSFINKIQTTKQMDIIQPPQNNSQNSKENINQPGKEDSVQRAEKDLELKKENTQIKKEKSVASGETQNSSQKGEKNLKEANSQSDKRLKGFNTTSKSNAFAKKDTNPTDKAQSYTALKSSEDTSKRTSNSNANKSIAQKSKTEKMAKSDSLKNNTYVGFENEVAIQQKSQDVESENSQKDSAKLFIASENEQNREFTPVYVQAYSIKEEKISLDKDRLESAFVEVFGNRFFNNAIVQTTVYDEDVSSYVYIKQSTDEVHATQSLEKAPLGSNRFSKDEIEKRADNFLKKLGLSSFKLFVEEKDESYLVSIHEYFQNIEIYDAKSYLRFDYNGNIREGLISLRKFELAEKLNIVDIKTALFLFKEKYGLKDVKLSDVKLVYKRFDNLYKPIYLYINANKIYWLEQ